MELFHRQTKYQIKPTDKQTRNTRRNNREEVQQQLTVLVASKAERFKLSEHTTLPCKFPQNFSNQTNPKTYEQQYNSTKSIKSLQKKQREKQAVLLKLRIISIPSRS